jgi:aldehyde dehydrogenase (NAD+)
VGPGVAAAAMANGARVQLEMGGKNPLIVLDDADMRTAVSVAVNGAYFQRATLHRVEPHHRDRGDSRSLRAAVVERMKKLVVDDALKAGRRWARS